MGENTFDPVWENLYRNPSYRSWYPWSSVVSFVLGMAPEDRPRAEISILEIGCGSGNNVWFVAREGFKAAGVDASESAIEFAQERFRSEGLTADLRVADFTKLPFEEDSFDMVFDRGALYCTPRSGVVSCISEVRRVLKPGGLFQCTPWSDRHSSFYRSPDPDGAVRDIKVGSIVSGSQMSFFSLQDIRELFKDGWVFLKLNHVEETEMIRPERLQHCEWLIVVRKVGDGRVKAPLQE
jgi:SAM-dependent methyltransferase